MMKYNRILLKLSGEVLSGKSSSSIDGEKLLDFANEIKSLTDKGIEVGVVIGGGNIFRGASDSNHAIDRMQGDYMGMLATIINGLALKSALGKIGVKAKLLSGIKIDSVCDSVEQNPAKHFRYKKVIIISGGTGNPFFSTDTAAALRALELKAEVLLKGTKVDGVYSDDPEKNRNAVKYDKLTFREAYEKKLKVMDMTAFTLCMENNLPVIVFNINEKGILRKITSGDKAGTVVTN